MDLQFSELFSRQWDRFFPGVELPITFFYTDEVATNDLNESKDEHRCLIGNLNRVRGGFSYVFNAKSPGCLGGKRYTGYSQALRPNFEYFLSCGIPGKMEGERYKKSPELVNELLKKNQPFEAPAKFLVFKRWDKLVEQDQPLAVIFFAEPDVLAGLYTLANFDTADQYGVVAPMGSGCSSIISYPLLESKSDMPRCFLGMFDVSARPYVPENTFTFTIPLKRFQQMVENMDESFLITDSWKALQQ
jgi:hypothetical protein